MIRSDAAATAKLVFPMQVGGKYQLYAVFTTQDGHWYVEPDKPFSVPEWAINWYGRPSFMERGGAQHIFVRVEKSDGTPVPADVVFRTDKNSITLNTGDKPSGWQNLPIYDGYDPNAGEHGGWAVYVDGADLGVSGIGLPYKWHVSTFIVFRAVDVATPVPPPVTPPDPGPVVRVLTIDVPTVLRLVATAPLTIEINKGV